MGLCVDMHRIVLLVFSSFANPRKRWGKKSSGFLPALISPLSPPHSEEGHWNCLEHSSSVLKLFPLYREENVVHYFCSERREACTKQCLWWELLQLLAFQLSAMTRGAIVAACKPPKDILCQPALCQSLLNPPSECLSFLKRSSCCAWVTFDLAPHTNRESCSDAWSLPHPNVIVMVTGHLCHELDQSGKSPGRSTCRPRLHSV